MVAFHGCPPHGVEYYILRLATYIGYVDWLRGKRSVEELAGYDPETIYSPDCFHFSAPLSNRVDITYMMAIIRCGVSPWSLHIDRPYHTIKFFVASEEDALLLRLSTP